MKEIKAYLRETMAHRVIDALGALAIRPGVVVPSTTSTATTTTATRRTMTTSTTTASTTTASTTTTTNLGRRSHRRSMRLVPGRPRPRGPSTGGPYGFVVAGARWAGCTA